MLGASSTSDPILCAHLLRRVDEKLIDLLSTLTAGEWDIQTIAPLWTVVRDSCYVETVNIRSPQDLITLVNRLNREGVTVYRRLED